MREEHAGDRGRNGYFAAPDIILEPQAEQRNPERAAQIYANNWLASWLFVRGPKEKSARRTLRGRKGRECRAFPRRCTTTGASIRSRMAESFIAAWRRRAYCCTADVWGRLGYYYSSPVAADNKVYIASADGVVVVLDAGDTLKILATNKLDGDILATPALVEGNIYVGTKDYLYAFGN